MAVINKFHLLAAAIVSRYTMHKKGKFIWDLIHMRNDWKGTESARADFYADQTEIRQNKYGGYTDVRSMEKILQDAQMLFQFLSDTEHGSGKADIVLAMGSQDLNVPATAAKAFWERDAQWLVCSGGAGKDTAVLFHEPEAVLFARRCVALGVPRDRVLVEDQAANSGENFQFSKALLEGLGISPKTGVIAAKPYMAKRAWATSAMQWPEVCWSVAPTDISFQEYLDQGNELDTVLNLMVGDLQRLRVYAGRFQAAVEVPDSIWAAYERLAGDGYDQYVIRGA